MILVVFLFLMNWRFNIRNCLRSMRIFRIRVVDDLEVFMRVRFLMKFFIDS